MDHDGLNLLQDPLVSITVAVVIALVFAQALLHKLQDPGRFRAALTAYRLIPAPAVPVAVVLVLIGEALVIGALLWSPLRAGGLRCAAGLLLLYALAMALNLLRGRRDLDCGCGGQAQPLHGSLVIRNGVMAAIALVASVPAVARPLDVFDMLAVAAAGIGLWGLTHVADELLRQGARLATLRHTD